MKSFQEASFTVLETSAVGSLISLHDLYTMEQKKKSHRPNTVHVVWLHFGVHEGATSFRLEERGWNGTPLSVFPLRLSELLILITLRDHIFCA